MPPAMICTPPFWTPPSWPPPISVTAPRIVPEGCSSINFPRLLGEDGARAMLEEARRVGAAEALAMGLVQEVVEMPRLLGRAREIAEERAARGRPRRFLELGGAEWHAALREANRQESVALAESFLQRPFLEGQYLAAAAKGVDQLEFWKARDGDPNPTDEDEDPVLLRAAMAADDDLDRRIAEASAAVEALRLQSSKLDEELELRAARVAPRAGGAEEFGAPGPSAALPAPWAPAAPPAAVQEALQQPLDATQPSPLGAARVASAEAQRPGTPKEEDERCPDVAPGAALPASRTSSPAAEVAEAQAWEAARPTARSPSPEEPAAAEGEPAPPAAPEAAAERPGADSPDAAEGGAAGRAWERPVGPRLAGPRLAGVGVGPPPVERAARDGKELCAALGRALAPEGRAEADAAPALRAACEFLEDARDTVAEFQSWQNSTEQLGGPGVEVEIDEVRVFQGPGVQGIWGSGPRGFHATPVATSAAIEAAEVRIERLRRQLREAEDDLQALHGVAWLRQPFLRLRRAIEIVHAATCPNQLPTGKLRARCGACAPGDVAAALEMRCKRVRVRTREGGGDLAEDDDWERRRLERRARLQRHAGPRAARGGSEGHGEDRAAPAAAAPAPRAPPRAAAGAGGGPAAAEAPSAGGRAAAAAAPATGQALLQELDGASRLGFEDPRWLSTCAALKGGAHMLTVGQLLRAVECLASAPRGAGGVGAAAANSACREAADALLACLAPQLGSLGVAAVVDALRLMASFGVAEQTYLDMLLSQLAVLGRRDRAALAVSVVAAAGSIGSLHANGVSAKKAASAAGSAANKRCVEFLAEEVVARLGEFREEQLAGVGAPFVVSFLDDTQRRAFLRRSAELEVGLRVTSSEWLGAMKEIERAVRSQSFAFVASLPDQAKVFMKTLPATRVKFAHSSEFQAMGFDNTVERTVKRIRNDDFGCWLQRETAYRARIFYETIRKANRYPVSQSGHTREQACHRGVGMATPARSLLLEREETGYGENDPLVDHEFQQSSDASGPDLAGLLRYCRFRIDGFEGEKHAVFIPEGTPLSRELIQEICELLDRDPPSMTLSGQGTLLHPMMIATPELRACQGFRPLVEEAHSSLGIRKKSEGCWCGATSDAGRPDDGSLSEAQSQALQDFANAVLDKKITSMVGSIASAASETNTWFLTGPTVSTFDVFLQQCVQCDCAEPFRVVAAHMQDAAWMRCKTSIELMRMLFAKSRPLNSCCAEELECTELPGSFWQPESNQANPEFSQHGFGFWSFQKASSAYADRHPVTQFPWPFADLFLLRFRALHDGVPSAPVQADWTFATEQALDSNAAGFQHDFLGPTGSIFVGGATKGKLIQCIQSACPTVIMDNTPGVSKQWGSLVSLIRRVLDSVAKKEFRALGHCGGSSDMWDMLPPLTDGMSILQALSPSRVLDYIDTMFSTVAMEQRSRLTLGDVVFVLETAKSRPQTFKEAVQVLNPLEDSPEDAICCVTSMLCSSMSAKEASPAHRGLVLQGWRLHHRLTRRADTQRRLATLLAVATSVILLASICVAVALIDGQLEGVRLDEGRLEQSLEVDGGLGSGEEEPLGSWLRLALSVAAAALPLLAGALVRLHGRLRPVQEAARAQLAAAQVVAEIYFFLGGTCRAAEPDQADHARRLARRLREISGEALAGLADGGDDDDGPAPDFAADPGALRRHVSLSLYGVSERGGRCSQLLACLGGGDPRDDLAQGGADPLLPVSVESYVSTRMAPLAKRYSRWARAMNASRTHLGLLVFLLLCGATVLGAMGLVVVIPPTLGLASCIATLQARLAPAASVSAVNYALSALTNLDLHWHGLSVAERSSEDTKHRLVSSTEQIALAVAMAVTQIPDLGDDDDEDQDGGPIVGRHAARGAATAPCGRRPKGAVTPRSGGTPPPSARVARVW
ncbi:unnamed protein product [Prorocentrum cordatum]|uniref:Uncharacterized protein n=1 Tax=Prorocentrum cordatum TaxID=2364126 RepID=A0ABN9QCP2_9DINO|nr:unnamed protein product [Polarella glacialis]